MILAALLLHGDDPRMELIYFFSALILAVLPIGAFAAMCVWVFKRYRRERAAGFTPSPTAAGDAPPPTAR
jgi:energy-coupling factor transporter transmembrane protein EcfT